MITKINEEVFKTQVVNDPVAVVDFSATWCGPCRMLAPVLEDLSEQLEGRAKFYNVDVDDDSALAAGFGIPGVVLLGGCNIYMLFSGSVLFGIFAGMFYFMLVFHALSHPARSGRYIGVNEMLLGLTGIAGPALGGMAANAVSISAVFCACAVLIAAAAGIAITYKWKNQSFDQNIQKSGGI